MMKKIKLLALTILLTSTFCCTAFASVGKQEEDLSTEHVARGVVYDEPENEKNVSPAAVTPSIFQVKNVKVYPVYVEPESPSKFQYDKSIYVENTIPGNNWGQTNFLRVSPQTTQRLLHSFDDIGYEVSFWRMEMDCRVANYQRPARFEFTSLDGSEKVSGMAYNGTRTFDLYFPVQDTTEQYGNGYKGTFSYYTTTGSLASLMAGGYVYLNSPDSNAK